MEGTNNVIIWSKFLITCKNLVWFTIHFLLLYHLTSYLSIVYHIPLLTAKTTRHGILHFDVRTSKDFPAVVYICTDMFENFQNRTSVKRKD